jgi:Protein of unknown function (DUF3800)
MRSFGDYIVYADESGDHNLENINPDYPVFVLAFCVFLKSDFYKFVVPSIQKLKFDYWGHDGVVLHSYEIRKAKGDFNILLNAELRTSFLNEITAIIENNNFMVISAVIDKSKHVKRYHSPSNPYEIALTFCMERLQRWLIEKGQAEKQTHVVFERRGKSEDNDLELNFRRITSGQNAFAKMQNLEIRFMDKKHNSSGLQFADLVAFPIGRHIVKPDQPNRAYTRIEPKFRRSANGKVIGYGLKIFP